MPQLSSKPLRVGLVVGETSGANIALGMLKQIKALHPNCIIEGIGSQPLIEQGMHSLFEMDELSVMGLVEVLQHLPRLLHIRKTVVQHFLDNPPDVFIGVDAPDFNLPVEQKLKDAGIPTVHYVSPTVWAWREKRIHKIGKATNLVLGVFPFEQAIYDQYNLPFQFVGHTMADSIPVEVDQMQARERLSIEAKSELLALLPGSRKREIESLLSIFLDTYRKVKVHSPHLKVIIPAVSDVREAQIREILKQENMLESCTITRAAARDVMIAADCALLASGTAALEAMLCKCPMVVAYKMSTLTYMMMKRLYKPAYFSLPNILANELLVPEFLQDEVNADNLSEQLLKVWRTNNKNVLSQFIQIHKTLAAGADKQSAKAVLSLINRYPA